MEKEKANQLTLEDILVHGKTSQKLRKNGIDEEPL